MKTFNYLIKSVLILTVLVTTYSCESEEQIMEVPELNNHF